jgi:hypothetical protein
LGVLRGGAAAGLGLDSLRGANVEFSTSAAIFRLDTSQSRFDVHTTTSPGGSIQEQVKISNDKEKYSEKNKLTFRISSK